MAARPKYEPRPVLPAGHPSLSPQLVIANARMKLAHLEHVVALGDEEARLAYLALYYELVMIEVEAALEEIVRTGLTKKAALAVLKDRSERIQLEERHGQNWRSDNSNSEKQIDGRGGNGKNGK